MLSLSAIVELTCLLLWLGISVAAQIEALKDKNSELTEIYKRDNLPEYLFGCLSSIAKLRLKGYSEQLNFCFEAGISGGTELCRPFGTWLRTAFGIWVE